MKKKILLLDDSTTARMLFKILIKELDDIDIVDVGTWQDAIDEAKKGGFSLIIVDYNMPEKTGPEVAKILIDEGIETPFALMSANTQQHVLDEVADLGFIDVLEKPVSVEMVESLLEKL